MIERDPTLNTSPLLKKAEKNIAEKDIHFE
jgi:hypothetical protein